MNGYAVQDSWIKYAAEQRKKDGRRGEQSSRDRAEADALLAEHAPGLAGDGWAVFAVTECWSRYGRGNVTARLVREFMVEYHRGRFERGWIDETELAELLRAVEA